MLSAEDGAFYALDRSAGGLGDALVGVGRTLGARGDTHLQATLKLPTGDESVLAGSGSADLAVTLLRSRSTAMWERPAGLFGGVGALWLGEPDGIEYDARRAGLVGMVGGSLKVWRRTGLKAQVELHSALYD